jgi:chromosomal replication initiator protein
MESGHEPFWSGFLEVVQSRIRRQQFETWFRHLRPKDVQPDKLVLCVPNKFIEAWLADNYRDVIRSAAEAVTGRAPAVEFVVDPSLAPDLGTERARPSTAEIGRRQGIRLVEHYTFANFVVGVSNRIAHAACLAVSESPGTTYNPLFLHGSVGLGKSHLLQAACHSLFGRYPNFRIRYLSCEQFVNDFISAIQRNDLFAFRERYREADALMIDDIQFLGRAERSQEEFFHTFNTLYNSQRQIVVTCDVSPGETSGLQERLVSRFKSGLVARLDPPDYETRIAILRKKAQVRGFRLPHGVVELVASRVTANIRELEGAATRIIGYASITGQPVTLELAKEALDGPAGAGRTARIEDILQAVADHYGVKVADLQSKRRHRSIAFARQVCMHLARSLTNHSLAAIGGYFGGRDHSTVLHADSKIRDLQRRDEAIQRSLASISDSLRRPAVTEGSHPALKRKDT